MSQLQILYVLNNSFHQGDYVPPHSHTCYELIFYCNSMVEVKYNAHHKKAKAIFDFKTNFTYKEKIQLHKNSFTIVPPNVTHDEYHLDDNVVMCIGFTYNEKDSLSPFVFKEIPDYQIGIKLLLEQICDEYANKKYGFEQYMNNLLYNLILTLFRSTKKEKDKSDELKYIEEYIKQNIGRKITISSLADMSGYSQSNFRRIFKEQIGVSPKRYIANLRIEKANQLIKDTSLSLSEVAELIGFTDYFQFATFYKKECGVSPGRNRTKN